MPRLQTFPYLRAKDSVSVSETRILAPAAESDGAGFILSGWDPGMDVHVNMTVKVDRALLQQECQLAGNDVVRLAIVWQSSGTQLRGAGPSVDFPLSGENDGPGAEVLEIKLEAKIPGDKVARRLDVEARLTLAGIGLSDSPIAATSPGSRLWDVRETILLEGDASRFPVETVDFTTRSSLPDSAGWYLEWDRHDLEAPLHGRLRLLINSENKMVREAVLAPGGTPEAAALVATIEYTVAHALIVGALADEAFVADPEQYEEGSVGAAIRRLLRVAFPDFSAPEVATLWQQRPDFFDSQLQSGLRLFEDGG